jgi:hypothetical protein
LKLKTIFIDFLKWLIAKIQVYDLSYRDIMIIYQSS